MNDSFEALPILWGNKRYNSLNYYLRRKFGEKVFKIPLDAGFTCPNRDGKLATGGCVFCSPRGSGDFAAQRSLRLAQQLAAGRQMMQKKWGANKYLAYFQAFSNTYAPVEQLRQTYEQVLNEPGVVGLAIATRPDCLPSEVLDLLQEINERCYLWVELGLQTIHTRTARAMNMHYDLYDFLRSLEELQYRNIETCAHIILGLPGENCRDMMMTGTTVASLPLQGLKIHLLHVMQGTALGTIYARQEFPLFKQEEYVRLVVDILEQLPGQMVIHRLTGDSPRQLLLGPHWSLNKWEVLNSIDNELQQRNTWQGKYYCQQ